MSYTITLTDVKGDSVSFHFGGNLEKLYGFMDYILVHTFLKITVEKVRGPR